MELLGVRSEAVGSQRHAAGVDIQRGTGRLFADHRTARVDHWPAGRGRRRKWSRVATIALKEAMDCRSGCAATNATSNENARIRDPAKPDFPDLRLLYLKFQGICANRCYSIRELPPMPHPAEIQAARAVANLHETMAPRTEPGLLYITETIYLAHDPDGDLDLQIRTPKEPLLEIYGTVRGTPSWLSLNIALGQGAFFPEDIFGFVIDFEGCPGHDFSPFLRTGRPDDKIGDTILADELAGTQKRAIHVTMHAFSAEDTVVGSPGFHTLVIQLPKQNFRLTLHDLRVFVLPAGRGLRLKPETLGTSQGQ